MSKKRQILEIVPPLFPKDQPVERMEFGGIKCTYCHGNGWFWAENRLGERYKEPCPVCRGAARMKAVVTVEWKADKMKNEE